MSVRTDVLLWAQRVAARKGSPPHVLLEVSEYATAEQIQEAFHKIARTAHPDLHRHGLNAEELEMVTSAYAAVAGAYAQLRGAAMRTQRMRPIRIDDPLAPVVEPPQTATGSSPPKASGSSPPTALRRAPTSPPGSEPGRSTSQITRPASEPPRPPSSPPPTTTRRAPTAPPVAATGQTGAVTDKMSSKALLYYRKAETCLNRGDLKGAILQLKLACAVDPASSFLRTALAEVVSESNKVT
ncbi:MAG TPA: J domain-containing protein [Kofleriaceae bacterium]|nr:J domain-containing protein [Kofleriaceae bacterium]